MRQEGFWKTNLRPIIFGHLGLRLQGILRGVSGAFWVAMVFMEHLLREREPLTHANDQSSPGEALHY